MTGCGEQTSGDENGGEEKEESPETPKNFSPLRIPEISIPTEENKPQIVSWLNFQLYLINKIN